MKIKNFYIKNITVSGNNKENSVIDFIDGLNIICGPSNTGKSIVLKCIDYLFGSDTIPFNAESTGYNMIAMTVVSKGKTLTARREVGNDKTKNRIIVDSNIPEIESGNYSSLKGKRSVNVDLWPKLIGIEPGQTVIGRLSTGKRYTLTWRTILHMFLIKSENIIKERSILLPAQNTAETPVLSSLLFMITGNDFSAINQIDGKDIRAARKKAVTDFINERLKAFAKRKNELNLNNIDSAKLQDTLEQIIREITALEHEINAAIIRLKQISAELFPIYEKLAESTVLQSRFTELKTRYISDIKRFTLITEGETARQGFKQNTKCPFCDHYIQQVIPVTYFDAARLEQKRTQMQLKDLTESEKDVLLKINALRSEIYKLENEKNELEKQLNNVLKPKLYAQKISLAEYRKAIAIQCEIDAIYRFENSLKDELIKSETEDENELEFKVKNYYTAEITVGIEQHLTEILKACNFLGYNSAHFDIDSFDISVNGQAKSVNGEGYCAFLNTVMALATMEYLTENGAHAPSLLIIDSPILSLMERANKAEAESIKSGLFRYLTENQDNGQVIILDHKIPELDYENAQIIQFTQDETEGRYGFLNGVRHYD